VRARRARVWGSAGVQDKGAGVPRGGLKEGEGIRASGIPRGRGKNHGSKLGRALRAGEGREEGEDGESARWGQPVRGREERTAWLGRGKRAPTGGARASAREKEEGARPGAGPATGPCAAHAGRGKERRGMGCRAAEGKRERKRWAARERASPGAFVAFFCFFFFFLFFSHT
jgi:hypothetical protein